jgi:hypothetical protein
MAATTSAAKLLTPPSSSRVDAGAAPRGIAKSRRREVGHSYSVTMTSKFAGQDTDATSTFVLAADSPLSGTPVSLPPNCLKNFHPRLPAGVEKSSYLSRLLEEEGQLTSERPAWVSIGSMVDVVSFLYVIYRPPPIGDDGKKRSYLLVVPLVWALEEATSLRASSIQVRRFIDTPDKVNFWLALAAEDEAPETTNVDEPQKVVRRKDVFVKVDGKDIYLTQHCIERFARRVLGIPSTTRNYETTIRSLHRRVRAQGRFTAKKPSWYGANTARATLGYVLLDGNIALPVAPGKSKKRTLFAATTCIVGPKKGNSKRGQLKATAGDSFDETYGYRVRHANKSSEPTRTPRAGTSRRRRSGSQLKRRRRRR